MQKSREVIYYFSEYVLICAEAFGAVLYQMFLKSINITSVWLASLIAPEKSQTVLTG